MHKKIITKLLASIFVTTSLSVAYAQEEVNNFQEEWVPGRILVMPKSGLTKLGFEKIVKEHKGKGRKLGQSNIHMIQVPINSERDIVEKLRKNPNIKFAELDKKVTMTATSNDPYFGSQYHLNKIGAPTAWDTTEGAGIIIAVLDSGFDITHPDLKGNMLPGYNMYLNNTDIKDLCGHGTAVAGAVAGVTNNALGIAGVAGKAKILPLKIVQNDTTTSCTAFISTMVDGIIYAADHGAKIVNLSFGGTTTSDAISNAGQYLKNKGGLLFTSAGNTSAKVGGLANNNMIVVSSTTSSDTKSSFSSYGESVDLSAPGSYIYTTKKGGGYHSKSGTSFSSPIAAGVGALVMTANPSLTNVDVENILFSTAVDLGTTKGKDIYFGHGRVNAAAAVSKALVTNPTVDTTPPTASITSPTASSSVSGVVPINLVVNDNIGVTRVDLFINGNSVAVDYTSPFNFAWDSTGVANGMNNIHIVARDAAGNQGASATVAVNVANSGTTPTDPPINRDTTPPVISIVNPVASSPGGATVVSGPVEISVNTSDNSGPTGITQNLYIDSRLVKTVSGPSLSHVWDSTGLTGTHVITVEANDKVGNKSSSSVTVTVR